MASSDDGWDTVDEWRARTTPLEQRMAREFMEVEEGDGLWINAETTDETVEFYYVEDRPGVRELRARVDPTDGSQPPLIVYVVRERYVFIVWKTGEGELHPIMMTWPEGERLEEFMELRT